MLLDVLKEDFEKIKVNEIAFLSKHLGSCESKNCLKREMIPKQKKVMKKNFLTWNLTKGLRFQANYGTNCTSKSWLAFSAMSRV